jgi:hypothetical protein
MIHGVSFMSSLLWLTHHEGWWRLFRREPLSGESFADATVIDLATWVATKRFTLLVELSSRSLSRVSQPSGLDPLAVSVGGDRGAIPVDYGRRTCAWPSCPFVRFCAKGAQSSTGPARLLVTVQDLGTSLTKCRRRKISRSAPPCQPRGSNTWRNLWFRDNVGESEHVCFLSPLEDGKTCSACKTRWRSSAQLARLISQSLDEFQFVYTNEARKPLLLRLFLTHIL